MLRCLLRSLSLARARALSLSLSIYIYIYIYILFSLARFLALALSLSHSLSCSLSDARSLSRSLSLSLSLSIPLSTLVSVRTLDSSKRSVMAVEEQKESSSSYGSSGDPRGVGASYEQGTPVSLVIQGGVTPACSTMTSGVLRSQLI